jgi:hypothetical protein
MITTNGETFIKRFLAGQAGQLVGAIAVGIGDATEDADDARLQFEVARVPIDITAYDFDNEEVVWKGSLDSDLAASIYEVGLFTSEINASAGNQETKLLLTFESDVEAWDVFTSDTSVTRVGIESMKHAPALSTTTSSVLTGLTIDLSQNSSLDTFTLAYNVGNSNTSSVKIRLRTDASNYYEFTVSTPTTGYKFATFTKGSAAVTGTPDWSDISEIEIRTTATSGGAASVIYDGFRIDDTDTVAPEYGLVARYKFSSPISKVEGVVQDAEYGLLVNV